MAAKSHCTKAVWSSVLVLATIHLERSSANTPADAGPAKTLASAVAASAIRAIFLMKPSCCPRSSVWLPQKATRPRGGITKSQSDADIVLERDGERHDEGAEHRKACGVCPADCVARTCGERCESASAAGGCALHGRSQCLEHGARMDHGRRLSCALLYLRRCRECFKRPAGA